MSYDPPMHPVAERELEGAREAIGALRQRYGVKRLWIFGSATEERFDPERSDYDFLAEYGERPMNVEPLERLVVFPREIARLLNRDVDVVDWSAPHNRFFRRQAERTRHDYYAV